MGRQATVHDKQVSALLQVSTGHGEVGTKMNRVFKGCQGVGDHYISYKKKKTDDMFFYIYSAYMRCLTYSQRSLPPVTTKEKYGL